MRLPVPACTQGVGNTPLKGSRAAVTPILPKLASAAGQPNSAATATGGLPGASGLSAGMLNASVVRFRASGLRARLNCAGIAGVRPARSTT